MGNPNVKENKSMTSVIWSTRASRTWMGDQSMLEQSIVYMTSESIQPYPHIQPSYVTLQDLY